MKKAKKINWTGLFQTAIIIVVALVGFQKLIAANPVMDYCQFKGENGFYYLELYIDFPRESITYKATPDGWYGAVIFKVVVRRENLETAVDKWVIEDVCENPEEIRATHRMVDTRVYNLTPAEYTFELTVKDSISGTYSSAKSNIKVLHFPEQQLSISGIEIASHNVIGELAPKFNRGGYSLVPNPRRVIGEEKPYFFYYFEVYPPIINSSGLDQLDSISQYTIDRNVLNGIGDIVITMPSITRSIGQKWFAETDTVFVDGLESGSYSLVITVSDTRDFSFTEKKRFFVYQRDLKTSEVFAAIDSNAVEEELAEVGFMMSAGQRKVVSEMTLQEKASFLDQFWELYDDDPSTPEVPLRKTYRERVASADERWHTSRRDGHQTDRGRVYVLFGECDHFESFPLQSDTKPYEIWNYEYLDGGATFVFVDRSGLGDFELVHSTRKGEIDNPNWYEIYVQRSRVESRR